MASSPPKTTIRMTGTTTQVTHHGSPANIPLPATALPCFLSVSLMSVTACRADGTVRALRVCRLRPYTNDARAPGVAVGA
ncbi:hypothetical protein GCM10010211_54290 [Streptomyces albospinus]|uniref:Uncharacterized protein n=1 Tax=Streptomyces albospinus TaxID=285515 RepID=A0ABQ2VGM2_9ACTN|nr:hypothetical protein GCM10010211_54290 [Streptomyces albospinus]